VYVVSPKVKLFDSSGGSTSSEAKVS